jgi:hypothetical protein
MSEARDLVFLCNGVELTDESVENVPAELPRPIKGGTMRRGGKVWTVVEVRKQKRLPLQGTRSVASSLAMSPTVVRTRFRPNINIPQIFHAYPGSHSALCYVLIQRGRDPWESKRRKNPKEFRPLFDRAMKLIRLRYPDWIEAGRLDRKEITISESLDLLICFASDELNAYTTSSA